MNPRITAEERAWIADQILKRVPSQYRENQALITVLGGYIEHGNLSAGVGQKLQQTVDYMEQTIDENDLHDPDKRDAYIQETLPDWVERFTGNAAAGDLITELFEQYDDPTSMTDDQKQQFAFGFVQQMALSQAATPQDRQNMKRMFDYMAREGMPDFDNPRAMRAYIEKATRSMYPTATEAEINAMIEQNLALYNQDRRRGNRWRRIGCLLGLVVIALVVLLVVLALPGITEQLNATPVPQ